MDERLDERGARLIRWGQRCQRVGLQMAALGLLGGLMGVISRNAAGLTEAEQRASGYAEFLAWLFGAIFLLGLLVVLPAASIFYRRAGAVCRWGVQPEGRTAELDEEGEDLAQREILSPWLGWPLWALVALASLALIYALLFHGLPSWFAKG
jgi:hypothetical protein